MFVVVMAICFLTSLLIYNVVLWKRKSSASYSDFQLMYHRIRANH